MPGRSTLSGLGAKTRRVTVPVDTVTVTSANSSSPGWAKAEPSSSSTLTRALPSASTCSWPEATSFFRRSNSTLDWLTSMYMGSSCWMVARAVACWAVTSAPSVTWDLPMRPEMGALTSV